MKEHITPGDLVMIVSDSQLLVRQIEGAYKVKNQNIKPLFTASKKLLQGMNYNIAHVLREDNTNADEMANQGVDKKTRVPQKYLTLLEHHGILL